MFKSLLFSIVHTCLHKHNANSLFRQLTFFEMNTLIDQSFSPELQHVVHFKKFISTHIPDNLLGVDDTVKFFSYPRENPHYLIGGTLYNRVFAIGAMCKYPYALNNSTSMKVIVNELCYEHGWNLDTSRLRHILN